MSCGRVEQCTLVPPGGRRPAKGTLQNLRGLVGSVATADRQKANFPSETRNAQGLRPGRNEHHVASRHDLDKLLMVASRLHHLSSLTLAERTMEGGRSVDKKLLLVCHSGLVMIIDFQEGLSIKTRLTAHIETVMSGSL